MIAEKSVLENGLRVLTHKVPLHSVSIAIGIGYGSVDDKKEKAGSAHYLEHMLFKGTKTKPWQQLNRELRNMGASWNGETGFESTIYYIKVYKGYADKAADILADIIANPAINENDFEIERKTIMSENNFNNDDPIIMSMEYLPKLIYKEYPARMPIGGDNESTLPNITSNDLREIHSNYYTAENMVLSIYGGIEKNHAMEIAEKFSGLKKNMKHLERKPCTEKQKREEKIIIKRDISQAVVSIGLSINGLIGNIEEYYMLDVLEELLNNRIFDEIREKQGLSYTPMADIMQEGNFGYIMLLANTSTKNLEKTRNALEQELKRLENQEISIEDFNIAKMHVKASAKMALDNVVRIPVDMIDCELSAGRYELPLNEPEEIKNITINDIKELCSKYINLDNAAFLTVLPEENK